MPEVTLNNALSNNFILSIHELPIVSELAQDVIVPPLTLNPVDVENRWVKYPEMGEKIIYSECDIGFMIDENWDSYTEVYNWMSKAAGTSHHTEESRKQVFSDVSIMILNNSRNPIRKLVFLDAWPTTLGAVALDSGGSLELQGILTLAYTEMRIEVPDNDITGITRHAYSTNPT